MRSSLINAIATQGSASGRTAAHALRPLTVVAALCVIAPASAGPEPEAAAVLIADEDAVLALAPQGVRRIAPAPEAEAEAEAEAEDRIPLPEPLATSAAATISGSGRLVIAATRSGVWIRDPTTGDWSLHGEGLPGAAITSLAAHAAAPDIVYAQVAGDGIYRSEDGGVTWMLMDAGPEDMSAPMVHSDMPGSMQTGWLFVAAGHAVHRSMDCFCLWREVARFDAPVRSLAIDPRAPERIYAAAGDVVMRSPDGGRSWERAGAPAVAARALAIGSTGTIYALAGDGSLHLSADGGQRWRVVAAP